MIRRVVTFFVLIFLISNPSFALQSTINLPNSEITEKNDLFIKDVTVINPNTAKGSTSPNITYGIGHNTELSLGVPVIMTFKDSRFTVKGAIEGKSVIYLGDKNNRLTIGGGVYPYLNKSICPEGFMFTHFTRHIEKTNTKISIGGYISGDKTFINTGGLLIILDQKLYKDLYLLNEYTTGNGSRVGYSVGLKYKIKGTSITGAVLIPNHGNNLGFQITVARLLKGGAK